MVDNLRRRNDRSSRRRVAIREMQSSVVLELAEFFSLYDPNEDGEFHVTIPFGKHAELQMVIRPRSLEMAQAMWKEAERMRLVAERIDDVLSPIFASQHSAAFVPGPIHTLVEGAFIWIEISGCGLVRCESADSVLTDVTWWLTEGLKEKKRSDPSLWIKLQRAAGEIRKLVKKD